MSIALQLAEKIRGLGFDALPDEAVHWARVGIIDTVGVTLAGAREPCATIAGRVAAPAPGDALVFGRNTRLAPTEAAWINGTAAHALDFDDCSNTLGGHPSAPILPALFALAEAEHATGRDFVAAYVAGFETETRVARAVNFHHYEKGWHPTATLGGFGAAAACAHLLGLPPERIATALAIAASFASGLKANFGTMTKPLHVGQCTRNGLVAARLAREGFTASAAAFEHGQGFFRVFNGEGNFDADAVLRDWASPLDILQPGIAIKQYPCCGSTHPAIDALLHLREQHELTPGNVDRVVSWTHRRRLRHTNRPDPKSALDAKFSVQYCLARALSEGQLATGHFEGDAHFDPDIRAVMARITAEPHPTMRDEGGEHFGAEVRVFTKDGRVLSHRLDRALGRTAQNPLPLPRLEAKFRDCAGRVLHADAAEHALTLLWKIDSLPCIDELTAVLAAGVAQPAQ